MTPVNQQDQRAMRLASEPISAPLTLDEALARALKYNLDRRAKMMEEALALRQLDVSNYDMLPKLVERRIRATHRYGRQRSIHDRRRG